MYRRYKADIMAASSSLKVVMFLGSTREGRLGLRVAKFMKKQLEKKNYQVDLMDPVELQLPLMEKPFFFYKDPSEAPKVMQECDAKIKAADAYVVISCEYNHSIPPALANILDHFSGASYAYKPSGIVTYSPGIYGGMRAAMQLRSFLAELGCLSVSYIFGIPKVHEAINEDGEPVDSHMESGADKLITQLDWMAWAMKNQRDKVGVPPYTING